MTPHELLIKGRELISDEKRWTQGAYARTASGLDTASSGEDAVRWCSAGAMFKVSVGAPLPQIGMADEELNEAMGWDIIRFNDTHTHAEVLAAWDRAIAETGRKASPVPAGNKGDGEALSPVKGEGGAS